MIVKVKKVYYCSFCKKHSLRTLEKHELYCTKNPDRTCRLCGRKDPLHKLIERFKKRYQGKYSDKEQPKDEWYNIMDAVDGCPICTLAILRCADLMTHPYNCLGFDYGKELKKWWDDKNKEEYEDDVC